MSENQNKLYKDIVLEVDIDAKKGSKNQGKETKATFYSYDINSGIVKMNITKDNQLLPLPNGTEVLINVVKLGLPQQKLVFTGDIVEATNGTVYWNIPEQLRGYKGKIRAGVFINLPNGQRLHGGYFKFSMGISEIDTNLEEFEEDYWQGWNEFQEEAEAEWSDWKAVRDDTWKKQEKDYSDWKQEQENKQTDYENKTDKRWNNWKNQQEKAQSNFESNFVSWKSEQEEEQTGFESDFADWKNTQETKQTNFESDTNETINGINTKVGETQTKISDLEKNLDVEQKNYFSVEAWKERASTAVITNDFPATKIRLEANTKYTLSTNIPKSGDNKDVFFAAGDVYEVNTSSHGVAIDEPRTITTNFDGAAIVAIRDKDMTSGDWWIMLNKGSTAYDWVPNANDLVTKQELDVKVDKTSFDNFTEHGFLSLESGFKNYDGDNTPTSMQYMRVGNLMHIYGAVTNQKVLNKDSDHLVAKLPERFKVFMNDTRVCQASGYDLFTTRINENESGNYTNQIFIIRFRGGNGVSKDFEAGRWLNISLTCGVEVVD